MPEWALTLVYWLHMTATVVWIGSVAGLILLVGPVANRRLGAHDQFELFEGIRARLESLSWFCLFLILTTGLFQMSVNRHYHGLVRIENAWRRSLSKLLVLLLAVSALSWGIAGDQRAKIRYRNGRYGGVAAASHSGAASARPPVSGCGLDPAGDGPGADSISVRGKKKTGVLGRSFDSAGLSP
jgi:uncharacterized membrane protein